MNRAKRVLYVEDEPHFQEQVRSLLERLGYEMVLATNLFDGEEMVEQGSYDLFIFDNKLGEIRGTGAILTETAKLVLELVPPTIVFSSDMPVHEIEQIEKFGALFVKKSWASVTLLEETIARLLA